MTRNARRLRSGWIAAAPALAFLLPSVGCGGGADRATPEDVRAAAHAHVEASGGRMTFDDPNGGGPLVLTSDGVHERVEATEGGRHLVCVDFKSADGTVYDVDFYVDRAEASGELLLEDAVIHEVSGRNVLPDARRAELDRKN